MPEDIALTFPYTAFDLTEQVNVVPNMYGLVNELNLFPSEGSTSTIIEIRYVNGALRVLPVKERGSAATPMKADSGKTIFVECPHFPSLDLITPKDLQDVLVIVGGTKQPKTLEDRVAEKLFDIRNTHAITREWLRAQALQGNILDGNLTSFLNLYTVFNISNSPLDFDLGNASADIVGKCSTIFQNITSNLKGETMRGIEAIVDKDFFQNFVTHAKVEKYYTQAEQALALANLARNQSAGNMWGRVFTFQNITFREYYGTAPTGAGGNTSTPFWPSKTGTAYPVGTQNMFRTYDAPPNDIRFANTVGQEVYISPEILEHGQGIELKSESNALPICKRPEALQQLVSNT